MINKNLHSNKKQGFTLIELLVVISIIGVLSSVVLASLNSARVKARDAKRLQDVRQLKNALALYYSDYGYYPSVTCDNCGWDVTDASFQNIMRPYIESVAGDPIGAQRQYVRGPAVNNSYGIWVYMENTNSQCQTGVNLNPGWWAAPFCSF